MQISKGNLQLVIWLQIGFLSVLFLIFDEGSYKLITIYMGLIIIFHSIFYFLKHGGRYLTPSGLFLLYSALIHGFACIYGNFNSGYNIKLGHYIGAILVYYSQVFIYSFYSSKSYQEQKFKIDSKEINLKSDYFGIISFVTIICFIIGRLIPALSLLGSISFYVMIVLFTTTFLFRKTKVQTAQLLIIFALFLFYYQFFFSGFGRIVIATLVIAVITTSQYRLGFKHLKKTIAVMFYPSIIIASLMRGGTINDLEGGFGSIISPFFRFGQIIDLYLSGSLKLAYGDTIYAAFAVFIPRSIWPSKPWNFNRQITYIFAPENVSYGHSEASVFMAEMVFNFGIIFGFLFYIWFVGYFLKKLDEKIGVSLNTPNWKIEEVLIYSSIIVLSAGLLDLHWGGVSTYINRGGFRFIYAVVFLLVVKLLNMNRSKRLHNVVIFKNKGFI